MDIFSLSNIVVNAIEDRYGLEINQKTNKIYVTDFGMPDEKGSYLSVLDVDEDVLVDTVYLETQQPAGLVIDEITNKIYIANKGSDSIICCGWK